MATVKDIKSVLSEMGISYSSKLHKADLLNLLEQHLTGQSKAIVPEPEPEPEYETVYQDDTQPEMIHFPEFDTFCISDTWEFVTGEALANIYYRVLIPIICFICVCCWVLYRVAKWMTEQVRMLPTWNVPETEWRFIDETVQWII